MQIGIIGAGNLGLAFARGLAAPVLVSDADAARAQARAQMRPRVDVQISRLRKLIEADVASPRYIQTVWGVGYVFVPDGTA